MIEKIAKLVFALKGGHPYGPHPTKPWKRKKLKGHKHGWRRGYDGDGPPPWPGYGPVHRPARPPGLKGMILEAILRRLWRR